jgi:hypothetical protein
MMLLACLSHTLGWNGTPLFHLKIEGVAPLQENDGVPTVIAVSVAPKTVDVGLRYVVR